MWNSMRVKAYLTVEATIVLPLMIMSFLVFVYMTILVYNKVLIVQDSYSLLLYAREIYRDNPEHLIEELDKIYARFVKEKPYFSSEKLNVSIKKDRNKLRIYCSVNFVTIFKGKTRDFFSKKDKDIGKEIEIYLSDPVDIMLISRDLMGE